MSTDADNLKYFIEKIKSLNFFQRLFHWRAVRNQLVDAAAALGKLLTEHENVQNARAALTGQVSDYKKDLQIATDQNIRSEAEEKRLNEVIWENQKVINALNKDLTESETNCRNLDDQVRSYEKELPAIKESLRNEQQKFNEEREECNKLKNDDERRKAEHSKAMETFEKWRLQIQAERNLEIEERQQAEINKLKALKQTWLLHETTVKARMKSLCQKLTIEYADSVPFKGNPDNAIKLCNEYIIFDAKSPGSDDVMNFPTYLKDQAEKAKKYAKQDGVKRDIFFIVPSSTLDIIKQTVFCHGDFDVYVVSIDVLEPILLCLQKIETYEFAEQLTPEERENICHIIGRFTHLTKRRIQIDSFFARQFMEMVLKCESDLPDEIKKEVAAFERVEKLNPPSDRRTKTIDNKQLQTEMLQLELEIKSKGIATDDLSEDLNKLKLYKDD
jgi:hypothetical protein